MLLIKNTKKLLGVRAEACLIFAQPSTRRIEYVLYLFL